MWLSQKETWKRGERHMFIDFSWFSIFWHNFLVLKNLKILALCFCLTPILSWNFGHPILGRDCIRSHLFHCLTRRGRELKFCMWVSLSNVYHTNFFKLLVLNWWRMAKISFFGQNWCHYFNDIIDSWNFAQ